MMVLLAAFMLIAADAPRVVPAIPEALTPFAETGNRRARRRAASRRAA